MTYNVIISPIISLGANATNDSGSSSTNDSTESNQPVAIIGLVVGIVSAVLVLAILVLCLIRRDANVTVNVIILLLLTKVAFIIYRHVVLRNATSMNFDNPVYRKTTEEKYALAGKKGSSPQATVAASNGSSRTYATPAAPDEETMQPLTHPGANEYV